MPLRAPLAGSAQAPLLVLDLVGQLAPYIIVIFGLLLQLAFGSVTDLGTIFVRLTLRISLATQIALLADGSCCASLRPSCATMSFCLVRLYHLLRKCFLFFYFAVNL